MRSKTMVLCTSMAILAIFLTSCSVNKYLLYPLKTENVESAYDYYSSFHYKNMPSYLKEIIVNESAGLLETYYLYDCEDIFMLEIVVDNDREDTITINSLNYDLLDGNKFLLSRLAPHEAANMFLSKIRGIPPYNYQPKYNYDIRLAITGYIYPSGQFYAYTQGTVRQYEDPYEKIGYSMGYLTGALIRKGRNKGLVDLANKIYYTGFVQDSQLPKKTRCNGGIYWLKPNKITWPLILRIHDRNQEIYFIPNNGYYKNHYKEWIK